MTNEKVLAKAWRQFSVKILPAGCSAAQERDMRSAFYAGASSLFTALLNHVSEGDEVTDLDVSMIAGVHEELDAFAAECLARAPAPKRKA